MRITINLSNEWNLIHPAIRRPREKSNLLASYIISREEKDCGFWWVQTVIEVALILEGQACWAVEYVEVIFEGKELTRGGFVEVELQVETGGGFIKGAD